MEKRYQVFISSTFADLQEERKKVIETIMQMDCIPAGMELFPASNDEQFEFIKKIIDDCDYYILIIGGRYGSENYEGISYTEKEYDYALKKGLPILVFIHSNTDNIPFGKTEKDPEKREKLEIFKKKVSSNRLVKFWDNTNFLPGIVALSMSSAIKMHPQIGWVRGIHSDHHELLQQINDLRIERDRLISTIERLQQSINENTKRKEYAYGNDIFLLKGTFNYYQKFPENWTYKLSWDDIFSLLGPFLFEPNNYLKIKTSFEKLLKKILRPESQYFNIDDDNLQTIKIQLYALGLIDIYEAQSTGGGVIEFIKITDFGKSYLLEIKAIMKNEQESKDNVG